MQSASDQRLTYRGRKTVHTFGTTLLVLLLSLVILGQTLWEKHLQGPRFLLYWGCCFLLVFACIFVAMVDVLLIRRAIKQTKRELFERQFMSDEFARNLREKLKRSEHKR